ncbi:elongin-C-like isoform X3 [Chenopodium quinoa]|uniref:Elongin-C n=1 Tax=Chenopodium quinoa TaxID=63459 RepID=A0A803N844_CHEQI|nr:elongin-C-like isoform X3 [Chenopodium quinoa]
MEKEETVKLISSEGFEFVIDRKAAMVSQFLRNLLTSPGNFAETENGIVRFPDISTTILEKICQYFYWSRQYARGAQGCLLRSMNFQKFTAYLRVFAVNSGPWISQYRDLV